MVPIDRGSGEPAGGMSTGMGMQGAVLMIYGLNTEKMNCQKIFNLFCQYGNVVRVGDTVTCMMNISGLDWFSR